MLKMKYIFLYCLLWCINLVQVLTFLYIRHQNDNICDYRLLLYDINLLEIKTKMYHQNLQQM